jgi:hypothetical protein
MIYIDGKRNLKFYFYIIQHPSVSFKAWKQACSVKLPELYSINKKVKGILRPVGLLAGK